MFSKQTKDLINSFKLNPNPAKAKVELELALRREEIRKQLKDKKKNKAPQK